MRTILLVLAAIALVSAPFPRRVQIAAGFGLVTGGMWFWSRHGPGSFAAPDADWVAPAVAAGIVIVTGTMTISPASRKRALVPISVLAVACAVSLASWRIEPAEAELMPLPPGVTVARRECLPWGVRPCTPVLYLDGAGLSAVSAHYHLEGWDASRHFCRSVNGIFRWEVHCLGFTRPSPDNDRSVRVRLIRQ